MEISREKVKKILLRNKKDYIYYIIIGTFVVSFLVWLLIIKALSFFGITLGIISYGGMILYIKFQTDNLVENFIIESENYELENLLEEEAKEKIIDILYKELQQSGEILEERFILGKNLLLYKNKVIFFKNITNIYYEEMENNQIKRVCLYDDNLNKSSIFKVKNRETLNLIISRVKEINPDISIGSGKNILKFIQVENKLEYKVENLYIYTDSTEVLQYLGCLPTILFPLVLPEVLGGDFLDILPLAFGGFMLFLSILRMVNIVDTKSEIKRKVQIQVSNSFELSLKDFQFKNQICKKLNADIVEKYEDTLLGKNWLISSYNIIYINNIKSIYLKRKKEQPTKTEINYYLEIYILNYGEDLEYFNKKIAFTSHNSDSSKQIAECIAYFKKIYNSIPENTPILYEKSKKFYEKIELENLSRIIGSW